MARSFVTHSCGHEGQVFGYNRRDADSKARWASERECPECWKASQYATEQAAAKAKAEATGLPSLEGSEKQVKWAETIRAAALDSPRNTTMLSTSTPAVLIKAVGEEQAQRLYGEILAAEQDAINRLKTETSARWWIDNRDELDAYVYNERVKVQVELLKPLELAKK